MRKVPKNQDKIIQRQLQMRMLKKYLKKDMSPEKIQKDNDDLKLT